MFEAGVIVFLAFIYQAIRANHPDEIKQVEEGRARRLAEYNKKFREETLDYYAERTANLVRPGKPK